MIVHPDNQSCHGWWTFAKNLKASKSVLGASCYDSDWSGCNQANRENDGREEIVKSSGAEIVKRTWTEIRAWQETVVIWWTKRILTLCCWRMLTLPRSLTNTDHVIVAEVQKSKQSKNVRDAWTNICISLNQMATEREGVRCICTHGGDRFNVSNGRKSLLIICELYMCSSNTIQDLADCKLAQIQYKYKLRLWNMWDNNAVLLVTDSTYFTRDSWKLIGCTHQDKGSSIVLSRVKIQTITVQKLTAVVALGAVLWSS